MSNFIIKTSFYTGPLEIFLRWLYEKKIDPYYIPLSVILEEFLIEYLLKNSIPLKEAIEFLDALSYFMVYKLSILFEEKKEEKEEIELEKIHFSFEEIVVFLEERFRKMQNLFPRDEIEISGDYEIDPFMLFITFNKLLQKIPKKEEEIERIPQIEEKMRYIIEHLKIKNPLSFKEIILSAENKIEAIVIFLAILELIKISSIRCVQDSPFSDIKIYLLNK